MKNREGKEAPVSLPVAVILWQACMHTHAQAGTCNMKKTCVVNLMIYPIAIMIFRVDDILFVSFTHHQWAYHQVVLFTNFWISTRTTNYQSSKNGAYSSKHVRLREIFHKVKYLVIVESYNDG